MHLELVMRRLIGSELSAICLSIKSCQDQCSDLLKLVKIIVFEIRNRMYQYALSYLKLSVCEKSDVAVYHCTLLKSCY